MKKLMFLTMMFGLMIVGSGAAAASAQTNVALNKKATQSSTAFNSPASNAVNGKTTGKYSADPKVNDITHTNDENGGWWQVDLGKVYDIDKIEIWNRSDKCCWNRLQNFYLMVSETPITSNSAAKNITSGPHSFTDDSHPSMILTEGRKGRYVRIFLNNGNKPLSLAEVEVFGREEAAPASKKAETAEAKVFKKSLVGTWSDGNERVIFDDKGKAVFSFIKDGKPYNTSPYSVLDGKTVEFNDQNGKQTRAIMSIEDNNTTLIWHRPDLKKEFIFKRESN